MRISAASRPGRGHVAAGKPCQDSFAILDQPELARAAAAVADGLGSQPHSGEGSRLAAEAALASLAQQGVWDDGALGRAFEAARATLDAQAARRGVRVSELATTLQLAVLEGGHVRAAMVGDGGVVAARPSQDGAGGGTPAVGVQPAAGATTMVQVPAAALLLAPADGQYANEVVPLTADGWRDHLRFAQTEGDAVLLFSDGLTRLLLAREATAWTPFAPFFAAFLPRLRDAAFDARLVERFLARDDVDRSWDDDKCLVVLAHEPR